MPSYGSHFFYLKKKMNDYLMLQSSTESFPSEDIALDTVTSNIISLESMLASLLASKM